MGSSEMSQIHVLWSHFWRQLVTVDFDDVSLFKDAATIEIYMLSPPVVLAIGGLPKCAKFTCSGHTFGGCWLLLILMMFHYKSMVS